MGNQLKKLEELLKGTIREYTQRIEQVERQQKETYLVVDKLQAQQKTYQTQTSQAIENVTQQQLQALREISDLQVKQETYQTQTNESIGNIKTKHEELERKTSEAIGDIRKKAGQTWVPSEQGNDVWLSKKIFLCLFDIKTIHKTINIYLF